MGSRSELVNVTLTYKRNYFLLIFDIDRMNIKLQYYKNNYAAFYQKIYFYVCTTSQITLLKIAHKRAYYNIQCWNSKVASEFVPIII